MFTRRTTISSTKFAKQRRERRRLVILLATLAAVTAFWALTLFAQWRGVNIQSVVVSGNQAIPTADIQMLADRALEGNYLWFFPKSNIALYPRHQIASAILAEWPRISTADVHVGTIFTFKPVLDIGVTEKQPAALWCGTATSTQSSAWPSSPCYFMDDTGFIFDQASAVSISTSTYDSYIKFFGPIDALASTSASTPITQHYLTPSEFAVQRQFVSELQDVLGLQVAQIATVDSSDIEATLTGGSRLFFNDGQDPAQAVQNLKIFLANDSLSLDANGASLSNGATSSVGMAGTSTVDYIDLRYGGDIYYKLK